MARPHAVSLSLPRPERRTRARSQVSSELDLPCPSPWASNPLAGIGALPCPSSCGSASAAAVLVMPSACDFLLISYSPWARFAPLGGGGELVTIHKGAENTASQSTVPLTRVLLSQGPWRHGF